MVPASPLWGGLMSAGVGVSGVPTSPGKAKDIDVWVPPAPSSSASSFLSLASIFSTVPQQSVTGISQSIVADVTHDSESGGAQRVQVA